MRPEHPSVEAWSTSRLPFEPNKAPARPWLPAFRSRLRDALADLHATDGQMLVAEFATDERHLFDVENVLLYNVGLDAFQLSGRDGVRFERRAWGWVPQGLSGAHCYHRYVTGAVDHGAAHPSRGVLASWSAVPCEPFARQATASVA
ncbi:MAG TPA: hypothetical protein DCK98_11840 [Chloroflexi bacterium]|nr:hypothetical protein [Chloroflexota bacterium]